MDIEREILGKGMTAPRITPADIEARIRQVHYFTASDGVYAFELFACGQGVTNDQNLNLLTFCVIILDNGFTVTGESACASPENFDAEIGRKIAHQMAVSKIWPLLGFELKTKLTNGLASE